jgi:hypothetical protein
MSSPNKKQKGKSSPKGRGRGTRKTKRGQKPQILRVPGSQFETDGERCTVKYSDSFVLVQGASAGALSTLQYKLNSVFQVNATNATGTPQGVADLAIKYKKVIVESSRIHWRIRAMQAQGSFGSLGNLGTNPTNSGLISAVLVPTPSNYAAITSIATAAVQKYASRRHDWPRETPIASGIHSTELNPAMLWQGTHSMSSKKLDADPDPKQAGFVSNLGSADPSILQKWILSFQDVLADATYEAVWFVEVDLWYTIYCFDRAAVGDALVSQGPLRSIKTAVVGSEEKKAPPPSASPIDSDSVDVSPLSIHSFPDGYELVKRKTLTVLGARR